jgi:hypothetical protein
LCRFHAALIGTKGRVISSIMRELGGVNINFPKEKSGPKANVVTVRGPKDDVAKAKARLEELATDAVRFFFFLFMLVLVCCICAGLCS